MKMKLITLITVFLVYVCVIISISALNSQLGQENDLGLLQRAVEVSRVSQERNETESHIWMEWFSRRYTVPTLYYKAKNACQHSVFNSTHLSETYFLSPEMNTQVINLLTTKMWIGCNNDVDICFYSKQEKKIYPLGQTNVILAHSFCQIDIEYLEYALHATKKSQLESAEKKGTMNVTIPPEVEIMRLNNSTESVNISTISGINVTNLVNGDDTFIPIAITNVTSVNNATGIFLENEAMTNFTEIVANGTVAANTFKNTNQSSIKIETMAKNETMFDEIQNVTSILVDVTNSSATPVLIENSLNVTEVIVPFILNEPTILSNATNESNDTFMVVNDEKISKNETVFDAPIMVENEIRMTNVSYSLNETTLIQEQMVQNATIEFIPTVSNSSFTDEWSKFNATVTTLLSNTTEQERNYSISVVNTTLESIEVKHQTEDETTSIEENMNAPLVNISLKAVENESEDVNAEQSSLVTQEAEEESEFEIEKPDNISQNLMDVEIFESQLNDVANEMKEATLDDEAQALKEIEGVEQEEGNNAINSMFIEEAEALNFFEDEAIDESKSQNANDLETVDELVVKDSNNNEMNIEIDDNNNVNIFIREIPNSINRKPSRSVIQDLSTEQSTINFDIDEDSTNVESYGLPGGLCIVIYGSAACFTLYLLVKALVELYNVLRETKKREPHIPEYDLITTPATLPKAPLIELYILVCMYFFMLIFLLTILVGFFVPRKEESIVAVSFVLSLSMYFVKYCGAVYIAIYSFQYSPYKSTEMVMKKKKEKSAILMMKKHFFYALIILFSGFLVFATLAFIATFVSHVLGPNIITTNTNWFFIVVQSRIGYGIVGLIDFAFLSLVLSFGFLFIVPSTKPRNESDFFVGFFFVYLVCIASSGFTLILLMTQRFTNTATSTCLSIVLFTFVCMPILIAIFGKIYLRKKFLPSKTHTDVASDSNE